MKPNVALHAIILAVFVSLNCSFALSQNSALPDSPSTTALAPYKITSSETGSAPSRNPRLSTAPFPPAFRIGRGKWDFADDAPLQRDSNPSFVSRVVHRFGKDQAEIYSAPFRLKNLKWDALLIGATAPLIIYDERISRSLPSTHQRLQLDISGATIVGTSVTLGGLWIRGLKTHDEHAKEMGFLELESLANTFTVYTALQLLAARDRPIEAGGVGRFFQHSSVYTSFPGGHAMFTFAMASVVAHEYPKPWVQALAYGAATTVAVMRFTSRQHFASDVLVGGALGYLIGTHIFHSRCKVGLSSACHSAK